MSNLQVICGNDSWEIKSHCKWTAINFCVSISLSMIQYHVLWSVTWVSTSFYTAHYDFNFINLKYSLCIIYILFVFTSDGYVLSFHFVDPFVIKHMISVANIKQHHRIKAAVSSQNTGYYKHAGYCLRFSLQKCGPRISCYYFSLKNRAQ
jgi:hypothetical protein